MFYFLSVLYCRLCRFLKVQKSVHLKTKWAMLWHVELNKNSIIEVFICWKHTFKRLILNTFYFKLKNNYKEIVWGVITSMTTVYNDSQHKILMISVYEVTNTLWQYLVLPPFNNIHIFLSNFTINHLNVYNDKCKYYFFFIHYKIIDTMPI